MNIRFDFYTLNTAAVAEAMEIAAKLQLENFDVRRTTYSCPHNWNVCGEIDHTTMGELFDIFEKYGFVDDYDKL